MGLFGNVDQPGQDSHRLHPSDWQVTQPFDFSDPPQPQEEREGVTTVDLLINPYYTGLRFGHAPLPDPEIEALRDYNQEQPLPEDELAAQALSSAQSAHPGTGVIAPGVPVCPEILIGDELQTEEVLTLYRANRNALVDKPLSLLGALRGSHTLVTARVGEQLIGLGSAISDGHMTVYIAHLLVLPEFQGHGVGRLLLRTLLRQYPGFDQLILAGDEASVNFLRENGFSPLSHQIMVRVNSEDD